MVHVHHIYLKMPKREPPELLNVVDTCDQLFHKTMVQTLFCKWNLNLRQNTFIHFWFIPIFQKNNQTSWHFKHNSFNSIRNWNVRSNIGKTICLNENIPIEYFNSISNFALNFFLVSTTRFSLLISISSRKLLTLFILEESS